MLALYNLDYYYYYYTPSSSSARRKLNKTVSEITCWLASLGFFLGDAIVLRFSHLENTVTLYSKAENPHCHQGPAKLRNSIRTQTADSQVLIVTETRSRSWNKTRLKERLRNTAKECGKQRDN